MLRVVLPVAAIDLIHVGLIEVGLVQVRLVKVLVNVLVIVVYVLVVYVDIDIAAATPAIPTPASTAPCRSQGDAGPECNRCPCRIISWWRISNRRIRISRRAVNYGWIVRGNINDVGVGLLHHDNLFISAGCADSLCLNSLLSCRF